LADHYALSDLAQVLVLLIDVELMVDIGDLEELHRRGVTLFKWWAGMLGIPAFCGELQPIL
jgi:hypothetical protein